MKVTVKDPRSKKELVTLDLDNKATLDDLKKSFSASKVKRIAANRQRWTISVGAESKVIGRGTLSENGVSDGSEVFVKDLGPQISWQFVFLFEYFGPLVLYPLFYLQPSLIYPSFVPFDERPLVQHVALALWVFHYLKRELETLFVHRFSNDTMPFLNLFKNSGYYWGNTALCAYFVNHPLFTPPSETFLYVGASLFFISELMNLSAHITLRNLRRPGTTERNIPRGGLFELVSCANYTWEILAWVGFTILTHSAASAIFTLIGAAQMVVWALAKHRRYRKEFKDYPRGRKAIFPFII